ncbi:MAG: (Fe-S)-binding protein [Acidimicrobiia bacterium]|nr:(Fe-S)-binding protein [Acidimicrobiia bacterium]
MTLPIDPVDLARCVDCGLCLPHCPTFRATGRESASPRGRIAAMRRVQAGEPVDEAFVSYMQECVQCRGCEAACPSGVPFGRLMEQTRQALRSTRRPRPPLVRRTLEWLAYRVVLPRPGVLVALSWALIPLRRLPGLTGRTAGLRYRAESLMERLQADDDPDVHLFTGCVMDAWQRDTHRAALRIMRASGAHPGLPGPGAGCCGALQLHAGMDFDARRLARAVMRSLPGDDPIVVCSAGCGAMLKNYGELLETDAAHRFAARVRSFAEWLEEHGGPPLRDTGRTVVVQDPCHLNHVQKVAGSVRRVLAPAYRLVDLDDDGLCCGAGGAYSVTQPELAAAMRDRTLAAIRRAGGEGAVVASANPGCAMHLAAAGVDVRHPAELLEAALGASPDAGDGDAGESEHR